MFPEDTWALSNLDKVDAQQPYHEWLAQNLQDATVNRQIEGDDASFSTIVAPTRYGTDLQISRKTFLISGSLEASRAAGRKSEAARAAMVNMRELKRDMEYALTRNQASTVGGSGTARSTAGIESWIGSATASATVANPVVLATTTASATTPAVTSGRAGTAPTDGTTTGALTSTALGLALESAWTQGGDPRVLLVSPTQKKVIDTFTGIATRFVDVDKSAQATIIGAANLYVSDFGRHQVIMHRYMRTSVVLCLDPDLWAVAFLRRPFREKLAKTGDGDKYQMLGEYGLVARNWKGNAKVVAAA